MLWASNYEGIIFRIKRVRAKSGNCAMRMVYSDCIVRMPEIIPTSGTNDFDLAVRSLRAFLQRLRQSQEPPASQWKKKRPLRRQPDDHHFWSLIMLAVTAGGFLLVT
jgi:hypothetical protein